jgi:DNA-binding SARP family transcriptional activator
MVPDLRLITLGGLHLASASGPLRGAAAQRRSLALLAAIAGARDRGISRDSLAAMLWPESDDERARGALAQTLYRVRQELGAGVVIGGDRLRLDPEQLSVDLFELDDAVARGDADRAVALYRGPFLDGFGLPAAPELSRWIDEERGRVAARYADVLARAASAADAAGEPSDAARWWRALLGVNPLDARVVVQLMRALAAVGDSAGALQVARVHEALVRQELDVAADPIVAAAVASLRDLPAAAPGLAAPRALPASSVPTPTIPVPTAPAPRSSGVMRIVIPRRVVRRAAVAAGVIAIMTIGVLAGTRHRLARPVRLAVGDIVDLTGGDSLRAARALPELLTAGLGRFQPLEVVSRARLYDVATQLGAAPESRDLARTARQAGAELLVGGALYRRPDRSLRLDLQLLDLERGTVRASYQIEGADAFALAELATARVAGDVGASRRVTDPQVRETTKSLMALQLYEQGLRVFYSGDGPSAERLFSAALADDSTFAMAAYFAYRSANTLNERAPIYLAQAMRHAARATERERLIIRATSAAANFDPARLALAETLAARFPGEPVAHVLLGDALVETTGDYAGARVAFRQAFAMDSLGLHDGVTRCSACDAMNGLIVAYLYADSMDSAEREAERWTARQPGSAAAWLALASVRAMRGDSARATAAFRTRRVLVPYAPESVPFAVTLALRTGDFARAERLLDNVLQTGTPAERDEARWWLVTTQRYEGRLGDALETSRRLVLDDPTNATHRLLHAQVLFEAARTRAALAQFDSADALLRAQPVGSASVAARRRAWGMAHRVTVLAALGDTLGIASLVEPLRAVGAASGYVRDRLMYHYPAGLLLAARGGRGASDELRRAMASPNIGYTRVNVTLATWYLARNQPEEAVPLLRAALHGSLEASNLYVTHTELHALLARAFSLMRMPDSAAAHRAYVERALVRADPAGRARLDSVPVHRFMRPP